MLRKKINVFRKQKFRTQSEPPRMSFRGGSASFIPATRTVEASNVETEDEVIIDGIDNFFMQTDVDTVEFENGKLTVIVESPRDVSVVGNSYFG